MGIVWSASEEDKQITFQEARYGPGERQTSR